VNCSTALRAKKYRRWAVAYVLFCGMLWRESLLMLAPRLMRISRVLRDEWNRGRIFSPNAYAFIGDLDEAMVFIEKAVDRGFIHYPFLSEHAVILDRLRVLPRYEALLQRVKILWEEFQG
jgi:hypothetical protein